MVCISVTLLTNFQILDHTPTFPLNPKHPTDSKFNKVLNFAKFSYFKGLVKTSATWSLVLQYTSSNLPLLTWSLRKWYLVSMCLLFPWEIGFFDKLMADLLSTYICTSLLYCNFISLSKAFNHKLWQAGSADPIYLASQE